jgi:3-phenylpropionate/cinnamic acid dioxygenase small subunit
MDTPHEAVERLVLRYAELVDAGDFAGVGDLFAGATYRAVVGDGVAVFEGAQVAGLLESMVQRHEDGRPGTRHVVTNLVVDVDRSGDTATARSTFTVFQARPGFPLQAIAVGRYDDRFERTTDGWRFADRLITTELTGDVRHHLEGNPFET